MHYQKIILSLPYCFFLHFQALVLPPFLFILLLLLPIFLELPLFLLIFPLFLPHQFHQLFSPLLVISIQTQVFLHGLFIALIFILL